MTDTGVDSCSSGSLLLKWLYSRKLRMVFMKCEDSVDLKQSEGLLKVLDE